MGATMGKSGGNIFDSLPSTQGTLHVVMLGLDSAGKTTALYRLKFDQYLNTVPTIGFNCEKIRATLGKAKGVQFLVWDVGGQEKLRPLWRSYTRCTDGIVFVIDSVDVERMEEAKMELMRTAKCADNQGVPVLILANKQDLPGAREPRELEKLLSLHELSSAYVGYQNNFTNSISISPSSNKPSAIQQTTESNNKNNNSFQSQIISSTDSNNSINRGNSSSSYFGSNKINTVLKQHQQNESFKTNKSASITSNKILLKSNSMEINGDFISSPSETIRTTENNSETNNINLNINSQNNSYHQNYKGWYIQPACAITGEGLQEGLDALYDMISKKRKMNKTNKKKR